VSRAAFALTWPPFSIVIHLEISELHLAKKPSSDVVLDHRRVTSVAARVAGRRSIARLGATAGILE